MFPCSKLVEADQSHNYDIQPKIFCYNIIDTFTSKHKAEAKSINLVIHVNITTHSLFDCLIANDTISSFEVKCLPCSSRV